MPTPLWALLCLLGLGALALAIYELIERTR